MESPDVEVESTPSSPSLDSTPRHRKRRLNDNEPFDTSPGVICHEASTAWETRAFGGRVYPICEDENSFTEHSKVVHQKHRVEL